MSRLSVFGNFMKPFFKYKKYGTFNGEQDYLCEGEIEKSVPRDHRLSSPGIPGLMPIGDPRADFSIPPSQSHVMDSYSLAWN